MTDAFAIKDSTGRIIDIGLDEADLKRQWHPSYRCVPVQVTEGWIPLGEMKEGGVVWTGQNPHGFPVGTKFYAEPPKEPK